MHATRVRLSRRLLRPSLLLPLITLFLRFPALAAAQENAFYARALEALAAGDSATAAARLDSALSLDPRDWGARLRRASLSLAAGRDDQAEADYKRLLHSDSPVIRSQAHLGLGQVLRRLPSKKMAAIKEYRLAVSADPQNPEALYELAQLGFELGDGTGYEIADGALADLILLNPDYRGAYAQWRKKIKGHSLDNLRKVDSSLPGYIRANPAQSGLWLDIARDRFFLLQTDSCLAALDSLERLAPDYMPQDRLLLRARCLLNRERPDSFESLYSQALDAAERSGDFRTLQQEAEVIFTPREQEFFSRPHNSAELAAFFRVFWLNKDFDPTTQHNERLVEHYNRLRTAQTNYPLLSADGLSQSSGDYQRLMSRSVEAFEIQQEALPSYYLYEYDPAEAFGQRGTALGLDHRGLLYVRHGAPRFVEQIYIQDARDGFVENMGRSMTNPEMNSNNSEKWYYGNDFFIFKSGLGTGGHHYWPSRDRNVGDINIAMRTQTFTDPLPAVELEQYSAGFLAQGGGIELECYSSARIDTAKAASAPLAHLVLFKRNLTEQARDSAAAFPVGREGRSAWLAVNCLTVPAGDYSFASSLALDGRRAAAFGNLSLASLRTDSLCVSGIALGDPARPELPLRGHTAGKVLPRPSRGFRPDERITVYCEVYGLAPASDSSLSYHEKVTVSLLEKRTSVFKTILSRGQERSGSLSMNFERQAGAAVSGRATESFELDAARLVPGLYSLTIEVEDRRSPAPAVSSTVFTVE